MNRRAFLQSTGVAFCSCALGGPPQYREAQSVDHLHDVRRGHLTACEAQRECRQQDSHCQPGERLIHEIRGVRRVERRWATGVVVFGTQGVLAAYPQADLPTIKQFRVPLSIRERSS